jgi:hypothetical protein
MDEPIEEAYFNWLCAKILYDNRNIYVDLLRMMHQTEFVWIVVGDKNRADEGIELRGDFIRESHYEPDPFWARAGCSVLEMIFGLAKRAEFLTDMPAKDWFWMIMSHLELDEYRQMTEEDVPHIQEVLDRLVWRLYEPNGYGGMFPMRWPKRDQTKLEIWFQFCEFVEDQQIA